MNPQAPSFLRRVLYLDAALSLMMAVALVVGAALLASITGLPTELLRGAGFILLPFAAFVFFVALRATIDPLLVWLIVAANAAWVLKSILLLASSWIAPNGLGIAFVIAQALFVFVLAELEIFSLRRQRSAAA